MRTAKNRPIGASFVLVMLVQLGAFGAVSCRSQPPLTGDAGAADKEEGEQKIAEADLLYRQRDDLPKVRLGVALLRQARTLDYGSYEAAWKLAKFNYYLGAHTNDERERDDAFREGIDIGKIAVQLEAGKPDGHFWLGANYGGSAEHSTLAGLSSVEDIRREMEEVLRIDPGYQGGSAYLALGQLYLQAPRILGGDYLKAIDYLEKGMKFGSNNSLLRLHLADAYHTANRDGDARKQIQFILSMTPHPEYLPEYRETVDKAKKLLEKMDRK